MPAPIKSVRTFDLKLIDNFNQLHAEIHGANFNNQVLPNKNSSEAFGLEYLFAQSNLAFSEEYVRDELSDQTYNPVEEDAVIEEEEDNGIEEDEKTSIDAKRALIDNRTTGTILYFPRSLCRTLIIYLHL